MSVNGDEIAIAGGGPQGEPADELSARGAVFVPATGPAWPRAFEVQNVKGGSKMLGFKATSLSSVSVCSAIALAIMAGAVSLMPSAPAAQGSADQTGQSRQQWAASATGRVEPKNGIVVVSTPSPGRVVDVAVSANDEVKAGDLLIRLEEEDLLTRVTAAATEVQVRERERDEEPVKGLALERRQAEDAVSAAERALYRARLTFDEKAFRARTSGGISPTDVDHARAQINTAKEQLSYSRANLLRVQGKEGLPLATRLESSVATARAELSLAESAVERARVRTPSDGTVLGVYVKYGELATPSPEAPLILMGDLTSLRVKAEVEERDAPKVRVGQRAIVKGDAFPDKEFEGVVTSVSQAMAAPRIQPRGVRRPTDVEVIEVVVSLTGKTPLLSGMRVDVFFKGDAAASGTTGGSVGQPSSVPLGSRASAN